MEYAQKRTAHLLIFLTVLIDLIGFGILIPVLQPLAGKMGASMFLQGILMGVYSLMQFFFSPVLGKISDRIGRRPVILASLIGSLIGYLVIAGATMEGLAPALALSLLFGARVVTGICGASFSTAQAYLADITAPEKRAGVMGMIGAAFGLGFVIGPVLGGVASHYLGIAAPFLLSAALCAGNAWFCWKKLPESLPPENRLAPAARGHLFSTMRRMKGTMFTGLLAGNFAMVGAFSIMTTSFVPFMDKSFNFKPHQIGYTFGFIGIIGAYIQGSLLRKISVGRERRLALSGMVCMTVALALLPWVSPWLTLLLICLLMAVGNSLATPTVSAMASQCGSAETQGETMGALGSAGSLGRAVGPLIAGLLMPVAPALHRWQWPFWAAAAVMVIALITTALATRNRKDPAPV